MVLQLFPGQMLKVFGLTLRKGYIGLLSETRGSIRKPQALLGQQEHLRVQTEFHCNWITHLKKVRMYSEGDSVIKEDSNTVTGGDRDEETCHSWVLILADLLAGI